MLPTDVQFMNRALALAEKGRGYVEPNPLVGAVVVRAEQVVGEGWHQRFGEAHAEVNALAAAGEAARGATLYVTLEPCCHQGKTPPCTEAVIRAGVSRVVAAMTDPFPEAAGQGSARLRAAGVDVAVGVEEAAARRLNAPYLKLLVMGQPYVHAKWAMTLDGKIATRTGDSRWISNEASRRRVHELRGRMDGIVVGIGTALAVFLMLTARPPRPRMATRIVLDRRGRLPPRSRLARTAREIPTLLFTTSKGAPCAAELRALGCEAVCLPAGDRRPEIVAILEELGRRRMTNLLVEGGSEVLGSFLDGGMIDEVHVFVAPLLIGGGEAATALSGLGRERIADAFRLPAWKTELLDGDVYLHGWR